MDMKDIAKAALDLISEIVPQVKSAAVIIKIIDQLTALTPALVQEAKDLAPTVKNVIEVLRDNEMTPAEQMDRLDAIEAPIDAAFDAAAAAALAEDEAAKKT